MLFQYTGRGGLLARGAPEQGVVGGGDVGGWNKQATAISSQLQLIIDSFYKARHKTARYSTDQANLLVLNKIGEGWCGVRRRRSNSGDRSAVTSPAAVAPLASLINSS